MKAVNLQEPKNIFVTEREMPVREKGMALLKIKAAGICGSDIGAYRGVNNLVSYPRIIGHELAGEIVEIDDDNPKGLKVGDRVVVDPYLYCGHCYPCSLKRTNCCEDLKVLGVHVDGGMAEYFVHPADMLIPIPEGMSWELAPLSEPLTIALHALHRGQLKPGMHTAINGAGAIGLLAALAFIVVGATFVCYLLSPVGQKHLRPTVASMYCYVQPIVATGIVVFYWGTSSFNIVKVMAIALVFLGVYMVTQSKSRAELEAHAERMVQGTGES